MVSIHVYHLQRVKFLKVSMNTKMFSVLFYHFPFTPQGVVHYPLRQLCISLIRILFFSLTPLQITETTISNLQIVAEAVTRHDYPYALQAFNYLAQTSNLTETSAFLPGIKTLLAIAQQNQIYA